MQTPNGPILAMITAMLLTAATGAATETPEQRLAAAGHSLPEPTDPVATYVTWRRAGNLLFLSGHGECGGEYTTGKVGEDLTVEEGAASAEKVGLCMLATIKSAVGDLSRVKQFVRILGMVNATEDFTDHPKVVNGFSDLMVVAFGEAGKGARGAVGMASLPSDIAVEIEAIVELHPND
ncbi:MAG: RidA family protein [Candidatus Wenzhouxiangella sp. M2_3B_020]